MFDQPKVTAKAAPTGPSKENRVKTSKQPTLFGMKKQSKEAATSEEPCIDSQSENQATSNPTPNTQGKTGFMLWLEQNREQLQGEHPEATDAELVRLAAQKFKTLTDDERQVRYSTNNTMMFLNVFFYVAEIHEKTKVLRQCRKS